MESQPESPLDLTWGILGGSEPLPETVQSIEKQAVTVKPPVMHEIEPVCSTTEFDDQAGVNVPAMARDPAKPLCRRHGKSEAGISAAGQPGVIKSDRLEKFHVSDVIPEITQEPPVIPRIPLPKAPLRRSRTIEPVGGTIPEEKVIGEMLPARKMLLLGCGHNDSVHSLHSCFAKVGVISDGFDAANGPQNDPADTFVFDRILKDVKAGEYAAAYACPDTSLFAKLRSTTGPQRYGNLSELTMAEKEKVRAQNILCTRTAKLLDEMTLRSLPWICQTTATSGRQASILHLDEFKQLLNHKQVRHMLGVQCPFGALSANPMTIVYHLVDMMDMPSVCRHELRMWFSDSSGTATMAAHMPNAIGDTFSTEQKTKSQMKAWQPMERYTPDRNERPHLLNRYLMLKLHTGVLKAVPFLLSASGSNPNRPADCADKSADKFKAARFSFSERIKWLEPLRGFIPPTEKEAQTTLRLEDCGMLRRLWLDCIPWRRSGDG